MGRRCRIKSRSFAACQVCRDKSRACQQVPAISDLLGWACCAFEGHRACWLLPLGVMDYSKAPGCVESLVPLPIAVSQTSIWLADVDVAEPDYKMRVGTIPNDEKFSQQWHLPKISAPEAWDISTGLPDVRGVPALATDLAAAVSMMVLLHYCVVAAVKWDRQCRAAQLESGNVQTQSPLTLPLEALQSVSDCPHSAPSCCRSRCV